MEMKKNDAYQAPVRAGTALAKEGLHAPSWACPIDKERDIIMERKLIPCLAAFAAASAFAGPPPGGDQVAASFERMLNHTPAATAPAAPDRVQDPLRQAISAVLWADPARSYHVALRAPAEPKR